MHKSSKERYVRASAGGGAVGGEGGGVASVSSHVLNKENW